MDPEQNTAVEATEEVAVEATEEVVEATVEVAVEATPEEVTEEAPKRRRGKLPTKAQINSTEELIAYVRDETANGTSDEDIATRVKEVLSGKFTEQKDLIFNAVWPTVAKATPAKQNWLNTEVIAKIKNARKPRF